MGRDLIDEQPVELNDRREAARKRIEGRRDFWRHAAAYVLINGFLVAVWALSGGGYFWPAWIMGFWAVGLFFHAWDVFWRWPITEADIDRELQRHD
jgi:hypothetical protein